LTANLKQDKLLGLLRTFFLGLTAGHVSGHSMSYAIIRTGGKQFRAEPGKSLRIPSLLGEAGTSVEFNDVLLGSDGNSIRTGVPSISGAKVTGEIVKHGLGEKIVVFKFKRRKNYARKQGHRQKFTEVRINEITLG
jgi:large subunit ribosomal protein L21